MALGSLDRKDRLTNYDFEYIDFADALSLIMFLRTFSGLEAGKMARAIMPPGIRYDKETLKKYRKIFDEMFDEERHLRKTGQLQHETGIQQNHRQLEYLSRRVREDIHRREHLEVGEVILADQRHENRPPFIKRLTFIESEGEEVVTEWLLWRILSSEQPRSPPPCLVKEAIETASRGKGPEELSLYWTQNFDVQTLGYLTGI